MGWLEEKVMGPGQSILRVLGGGLQAIEGVAIVQGAPPQIKPLGVLYVLDGVDNMRVGLSGGMLKNYQQTFLEQGIAGVSRQLGASADTADKIAMGGSIAFAAAGPAVAARGASAVLRGFGRRTPVAFPRTLGPYRAPAFAPALSKAETASRMSVSGLPPAVARGSETLLSCQPEDLTSHGE